MQIRAESRKPVRFQTLGAPGRESRITQPTRATASMIFVHNLCQEGIDRIAAAFVKWSERHPGQPFEQYIARAQAASKKMGAEIKLTTAEIKQVEQAAQKKLIDLVNGGGF